MLAIGAVRFIITAVTPYRPRSEEQEEQQQEEEDADEEYQSWSDD